MPPRRDCAASRTSPAGRGLPARRQERVAGRLSGLLVWQLPGSSSGRPCAKPCRPGLYTARCAGPGRTRQSKAAALHPTCSVSGAGVAPLHPTCRGSGFTPRLPSHGRTATRPRPRCWSWPPSSHGEAECGPRGPYVASAKRELGHGVTPLKRVRHEGRATPG